MGFLALRIPLRPPVKEDPLSLLLLPYPSRYRGEWWPHVGRRFAQGCEDVSGQRTGDHFTILEKPAAIKVLESVTGAQAQLHWMQFGKWHLVFDDVYSAVNNPFNLSLGYSNGGDNFEVARLDNNHDDPMEFVSLGNLLALLEQAGLVKFRCGWCRTYQKLLRSCMGCERVRYCGKECQRADWMRHKSLCRKK